MGLSHDPAFPMELVFGDGAKTARQPALSFEPCSLVVESVELAPPLLPTLFSFSHFFSRLSFFSHFFSRLIMAFLVGLYILRNRSGSFQGLVTNCGDFRAILLWPYY